MIASIAECYHDFMFRRFAILPALCVLGIACANSGLDALSDADRAQRVAEMFRKEAAAFDAPVMPIEDAAAHQDTGDLVIVDARSREEMAVSKIPGAISIGEYRGHGEQYEDKEVAVYCTIGRRSGALAEELRSQGVDAYNLDGSILGWVHDGKPLVDVDGNEVSRVHVYGRTWDLAPTSYETTY